MRNWIAFKSEFKCEFFHMKMHISLCANCNISTDMIFITHLIVYFLICSCLTILSSIRIKFWQIYITLCVFYVSNNLSDCFFVFHVQLMREMMSTSSVMLVPQWKNTSSTNKYIDWAAKVNEPETNSAMEPEATTASQEEKYENSFRMKSSSIIVFVNRVDTTNMTQFQRNFCSYFVFHY